VRGKHRLALFKSNAQADLLIFLAIALGQVG
jgi:hypothetical protein